MPFQKGEKNPRCKLTCEDVKYIFSNPDSLTQMQLAAVYGISQVAVNHIKRQRTWGHITDGLRLQNARQGA